MRPERPARWSSAPGDPYRRRVLETGSTSRWFAASLVLLLLVAGCGGSSQDTASSTGDSGATSPTTTLFDIPDQEFVDLTGRATADVNVVDNTFEPSFLKVSPGTRLILTNNGRNEHNVTPLSPGSFDKVPTDDFAPGKKASITAPSSAGDFAFYCSIHGTKKLNGQSGIIRVVAG